VNIPGAILGFVSVLLIASTGFKGRWVMKLLLPALIAANIPSAKAYWEIR